MKVWIEYPYDRGSPHELHGEGGEVAVISADAAGELLALGIPDKAPGIDPQTLEHAPCRGCISVDARLSLKAKRMLGAKL